MKALLKTSIWALPLSGLLLTISVILRGKVIDPASDPAGFIRFVSAANFQLGATLNLFHFVILFMGVVSLGLVLVELSNSLISKLGLLFFFISHCLTFSYLGLLAFIYQKSASYDAGVLDLFNISKNTAILPVVMVDTLSYILGLVLTVIAMIRSKAFSYAAWLLFGLSFLLVGVIPPATLAANPSIARMSELLGNPLILISGVLIARTVNKLFK